MRIVYELNEFSDSACENISQRLLTHLIPHILGNKFLLIDNSDEDAVKHIVSQLISGETPDEPLTVAPHVGPRPTVVADAHWWEYNVSRIAIQQGGSHVPFQQTASQIATDQGAWWQQTPSRQQSASQIAIRGAASRRQIDSAQDEPGAIATAGGVIGGGLGVLTVIAAFLEPTDQGRIHIFLIPIIFSVVGFMVGSGIEKVIRKARKM